MDEKVFEQRLLAALAEKSAVIEKVYGQAPENYEELFETSRAQAERLRPLIVDGGALLRDASQEGKRILFEGAQGSMLDLDAGTYPYVTSSWTGIWGIAGGTGFPPNRLSRSLAVTKAYCTRVGEGPFPTELFGEMGERLREAGNEYGATTGRPRRCGWFDMLASRYAAELNGLDGVFMTNLDVLSGFETIGVGMGYKTPQGEVSRFPAEFSSLEQVEPIWIEMPGWSEDITSVQSYSDLPETAQDYLRFLEKGLGVPIERVSVGPDRCQSFLGENGQENLW